MSPGRLRETIVRCAVGLGVDLSDAAIARLTGHAEAVLAADPTLHLTAIRDPDAFVTRHVGESLQGASLIDPDASGTLLDLGSGNGYPGLALCAARPGLVPLLAEASRRKAAFLSEVVERHYPGGGVLGAQIQRAADLDPSRPLRVLVSRAMGSWEKIVPRLAPCLERDGDVLIWAGGDAEILLSRAAWRRLELMRRVALVGRERSWIWNLRTRSA